MFNRGFCCKCNRVLFKEELVCNKCYQEFFDIVKTYLKEHKGADFKTIVQETKIPKSVIELFIKNGDLQKIEDTDISNALQEYQEMKDKEEERQKNLKIVQAMSKFYEKKEEDLPKKQGPKMRFMGNSNDYKGRR